jgi:hypothetical protein
MRLRFTALILFLISSVIIAEAQKKGYVEVVGSVMVEGKGLEGADIKVFKGNENSDNALTSVSSS